MAGAIGTMVAKILTRTMAIAWPLSVTSHLCGGRQAQRQDDHGGKSDGLNAALESGIVKVHVWSVRWFALPSWMAWVRQLTYDLDHV